ncbi:MAG: hypothetical protein RBR63_12425, partial [Methanosarcina vacuolata]|nr:hypothetical protein [Methanosarcina vacuolata]
KISSKQLFLAFEQLIALTNIPISVLIPAVKTIMIETILVGTCLQIKFVYRIRIRLTYLNWKTEALKRHISKV